MAIGFKLKVHNMTSHQTSHLPKKTWTHCHALWYRQLIAQLQNVIPCLVIAHPLDPFRMASKDLLPSLLGLVQRL